MQNIVKESLTCNGNGSGAINARGIPHRGWTDEERVARAADAVLGETYVIPSIGQMSTAFFVPRAKITAELKARAEADAALKAACAKTKAKAKAKAKTKAKAVVETANGAAVETTNGTTNGAAVEEITVSVTPIVSDTPAIRVALRRLAAAYGCEIVQFDGDWDPRIDRGPHVLRDVASGTNIWDGGLPVEGIADALRCLADEWRLPPDRVGDAWATFGNSWMT